MTQAFINFFKDDKFNDEVLGNFGKSVNTLFNNEESLQMEFIEILENRFIQLITKKRQWRPLHNFFE